MRVFLQQNDPHAVAAAAAALLGKFPCVPFSKCVFELELASPDNPGNWHSVFFLLLCCVFWCQRRNPGKVLPSLLVKQRFTSKEVKLPCGVFDEAFGETDFFQQGADSVGKCALFKGKDRHDTDGSLSLGKGKASVSVGASLSTETFCRSSQSVALVTPGSCVTKTKKGEGFMGTQWCTGSRGPLLWGACWIARWVWECHVQGEEG